VSSSIVLIGPPDALPTLRQRLDASGGLESFTDAEALEALDHIIRNKPRIVALEHEFSSSSRGTALINRIKDDPSLEGCEVRVIAHDEALNRVAVKRGAATGAAVAVDEPKKALDQRGTRRAPRVRIAEGIGVTVDGSAATLVDLSTVGAQVVSPTVLKPNQRVRVGLSDTKGAIRCNSAVAWASFEMPKGLPTRYRAGVEFFNADSEAIDGFARRHKKDKD
jgi:PilZ domain